MGDLVHYARRGGVGTIVLDDGKVNVMSPAMQDDVHRALDQAERDGVVTVIRGRPGVFSAGFDLAVLGSGGAEAVGMVLGGFALARRVLAHPRPVVVACTGHAVAMGAFLLQSGDLRIGVDRGATITANEVAIGLTLPHAAAEILRQRLTPAAFPAATVLAERFDPPAALRVGFLDVLAAPDDLDDRVDEAAERLAALDVDAQRETKARVRAPVLDRLDAAIERDRADFAGLLADVAVPSA